MVRTATITATAIAIPANTSSYDNSSFDCNIIKVTSLWPVTVSPIVTTTTILTTASTTTTHQCQQIRQLQETEVANSNKISFGKLERRETRSFFTFVCHNKSGKRNCSTSNLDSQFWLPASMT